MPELPEVETIRIGAREKLVGKEIIAVDVKVPKLFFGDKRNIINHKIIDVARTAKVLEIILDNDYSVLIHLKMTGQLVFQPKNQKITIHRGPARNALPASVAGGHFQKAYGQPLPHKYTHIIYTFKDGSKLYFNDLRKFGWHKIVTHSEARKILSKEVYGPEPFKKEFNQKYLEKIFSKTSRKIKDILIDQKLISGIGNIYANDSLYWAGILPTRQAKSLSSPEIKKLIDAVHKVFNLGLKYGGSSENTYVNIEGKQGKYMEYTATYQKKIDPRGHVLTRIKQGTRSSFYCPICQA